MRQSLVQLGSCCLISCLLARAVLAQSVHMSVMRDGRPLLVTFAPLTTLLLEDSVPSTAAAHRFHQTRLHNALVRQVMSVCLRVFLGTHQRECIFASLMENFAVADVLAGHVPTGPLSDIRRLFAKASRREIHLAITLVMTATQAVVIISADVLDGCLAAAVKRILAKITVYPIHRMSAMGY